MTKRSASKPTTSDEEPPPPVPGPLPGANPTSLERSVCGYESFARGQRYVLSRERDILHAYQKERSPDSLDELTARYDRISTIAWGASIVGFIGYQVAERYGLIEPLLSALASSPK